MPCKRPAIRPDPSLAGPATSRNAACPWSPVIAMTARPPQDQHPPHCRPAWPLRSVLPPMGALPTAPRAARAHVRDVLATWGLPHFTDSAVLVASEIVTNAVRQCHDLSGNPVYIGGCLPVVQLSMFSDRAHLLITVYDQAPGIPVPAQPRHQRRDRARPGHHRHPRHLGLAPRRRRQGRPRPPGSRSMTTPHQPPASPAADTASAAYDPRLHVQISTTCAPG